MALYPADVMFYYRAGITWIFCAATFLAIVRGWIGGFRFRTKTQYLVALVCVTNLAKENIGLRLDVIQWHTAAKCCRCRGGRDALGVWAVVEHVLTSDAYIWVLLRCAAVCFLAVGVLAILLDVWLVMAEAVSRRRSPPRSRVPERRGAGRWSSGCRLVLEIVLFLSMLFSCALEVPGLVLNYMDAAAKVPECCLCTAAV